MENERDEFPSLELIIPYVGVHKFCIRIVYLSLSLSLYPKMTISPSLGTWEDPKPSVVSFQNCEGLVKKYTHTVSISQHLQGSSYRRIFMFVNCNADSSKFDHK